MIIRFIIALVALFFVMAVTEGPQDALEERNSTISRILWLLVLISRIPLAGFTIFCALSFETLTLFTVPYINVLLITIIAINAVACTWYFASDNSPWNRLRECDHCGRKLKEWEWESHHKYLSLPPDPECVGCGGTGEIVYHWEYGDIRSCGCVRQLSICDGNAEPI